VKHSDAFKHRLRVIEEGKGTGCFTLTFGDGSKRSFNLTRNGRLKLLLACFEIVRKEANPSAQSTASPRALELAKLFAEADHITPDSRLWATIRGLRETRKEKENATIEK
jgi:hypothetical protein